MPAPETEGLGSSERLNDFRGKSGFVSDTLITFPIELTLFAGRRCRGQDAYVGPHGFRSHLGVAHDLVRHHLERNEVEALESGDQVCGGPRRAPSLRLIEANRGSRRTVRGDQAGLEGVGTRAPLDDLSAELRKCIICERGITHVFGIGNPIKQDDAVGLEVISLLRRRLKHASRKGVKIHALSPNPERVISDLASKGERIVVIDAVEAQKEPGAIVCARLSETKFGFFATHNVPLRLVPGVAENGSETYIVGIQPDSVGVGEGLSDVVKESSARLVTLVAGLLEGPK